MRSPTGNSGLPRTKSENLATATGTCRPRLPALIYGTSLVMSKLQNAVVPMIRCSTY